MFEEVIVQTTENWVVIEVVIEMRSGESLIESGMIIRHMEGKSSGEG